jgi:hypothetical protein
MRPHTVVIISPSLQLLVGIVERVKQFHVQTLVSKPPVKLSIRILCGYPRSRAARSRHQETFSPVSDRSASSATHSRLKLSTTAPFCGQHHYPGKRGSVFTGNRSGQSWQKPVRRWILRMHELRPLSSPRAIWGRQSAAAPCLHARYRSNGDDGRYDPRWCPGTVSQVKGRFSRMQLWLASFVAGPDGPPLESVGKERRWSQYSSMR